MTNTISIFAFAMMNLQLFAYDPTAQPVNNTGSSTLIPENDKLFYDNALIEYASAHLVHEQFAEKKSIPKNHGKTTEFRKYHPLLKATHPLTEGVTPDGKQMTVTAITATNNQYGDFIALTDVLQLTAIDNNVLQATKLLGKQAGETMDTVVRDALNASDSGAVAAYASSWSGTTETPHASRYSLTADSKLTVMEIQKVVRTLRRNNAPTFGDGFYVCIIHPDVAYDLMRDPEWKEAHMYCQPEEMYKGEIGRIAGVRFVQSTEAKIFWGADLCADSRTLTAGSTSASKTVSVSETLVADALIGRYVLIGTARTKITANTANSITVEDTITCDASTVVYPGEGGAAGIAVYSCLFLGQGAYGVIEVQGGGLETIIQAPIDPLHQRSTVGWKGVKTAKVLIPEYIVRLEVGSSMSGIAVAN